MRFNTLLFLVSLSCLCLAFAQVSYDDCCLKYVKSMSHGAQKNVVKYRYQKTDGGCNLPAVVLTLRKGRIICTNPADKWVTELMDKIDQKNVKNETPRMVHGRHSNRG